MLKISVCVLTLHVVGGLSALGAALYSIGIPKDSVVKYEADLKAGRFVMIAHGTHDELKKAREIAKSSGAQSVDDFESKDMSADQTLKTH